MVLFLDLDCQNLASLDFGMSDLEKEPFDLGIENFALRTETSPASFSTSEQVHSRGTEHIFFSTLQNVLITKKISLSALTLFYTIQIRVYRV